VFVTLHYVQLQLCKVHNILFVRLLIITSLGV